MPEYSTELRAEVDAAMAKATKAFPVTSHETPDYAEITFGSSHTQAMSMEPDTLLALNGMFEAVPLLTAHIDAQAERIAELERDNARLREGLDKLALELREYSEQWKDEGVASVIASRVARALGNYASDVSTNKYALKDTAQ